MGGVATDRTIKLQIRRTKCWVTTIMDSVNTQAQVSVLLEISDTPAFDWNNTAIVATDVTGRTLIFEGEVSKYTSTQSSNRESSLMKEFNVSHTLWIRQWRPAGGGATNALTWLSVVAMD